MNRPGLASADIPFELILRHCLEQVPAIHRGPLSIILPLVQALPDAPLLSDGDCYIADPANGSKLFSQGAAWCGCARGEDRLVELGRQARDLRKNWHIQDPCGLGRQPRLLCGFAFDELDPMPAEWSGFPNATLVLPEILLIQEQAEQWVVFSTDAGNTDLAGLPTRWLTRLGEIGRRTSGVQDRWDNQPTAHRGDDWNSLASAALRDIEGGALDKLVLHRQRVLRLTNNPSSGGLLKHLGERRAQSRIIGWRQAGSTLIAASPEQLLSRTGAQVQCDVLAGTAARSDDPLKDAELARQLLGSAKIRREHRLVELAILDNLRPFCRQLQVHGEPHVRHLPEMHHLHLRLTGILRENPDFLDLASALHPTPAVAGSPTAPALEWLRRHDQTNRGWYCGAAGWLDPLGNGELNVLLRCALFRKNEARLFAGAGLVRASQADTERAEIQLKLDAIQRMLNL